MTEEEYNEKLNTMDKCVEYWMKKAKKLEEELKDANKKVVHLACNQNKDLKRKFNKAKEIIKNLMVFAEMDDREYEKEYKEAEQFLKEE